MKIKVYGGLSIKNNAVERFLPGADVAEPIQRGQLIRDISEGYNVVAVIDGKFDQHLSVTPSEVMDALRAGVRVYGSSSMGALRAVECEKYGAIGCGKIFEFIKQSGEFRDDYLGQLFLNQNHQWQSKTYIDFYFAAEDLLQEKKITKKTAVKVCELYKDLFYAERGEEALQQVIQLQKRGASDLSAAASLVFAAKVSQKTKDALELLSLIKADLEKIKSLNSVVEENAKSSPDPLHFYPKDLYL